MTLSLSKYQNIIWLIFVQVTKEFEFPAKTVFANNSMFIDFRLRF